jgi:hypothetical protein
MNSMSDEQRSKACDMNNQIKGMDKQIGKVHKLIKYAAAVLLRM